jgi:hypothetical protein
MGVPSTEFGVAVAALALDPNPRNAFIGGDYRRLRVGPYRVMYVIDDPGLHGRPLGSCPPSRRHGIPGRTVIVARG